jgi:hypothetical protein
MELPPWLKIENLIGNLNLAGWFSSWFKRENKKHINAGINIENLKIVLSINPNETAKIISADEIPSQEIQATIEAEYKFTSDEKIIIEKVNQIHKINGSNYNFENSYRSALQHIKNKSASDWFVTAAAHMANTIQSGDTSLGIECFFNSFEIETDPQKEQIFIGLKEKIKYCYDRLQNLRHVDKSGELKEHMIPEYSRKISGQDQIPDQDYQQIFTDFQNLLRELFFKFKLKNHEPT